MNIWLHLCIKLFSTVPSASCAVGWYGGLGRANASFTLGLRSTTASGPPIEDNAMALPTTYCGPFVGWSRILLATSRCGALRLLLVRLDIDPLDMRSRATGIRLPAVCGMVACCPTTPAVVATMGISGFDTLVLLVVWMLWLEQNGMVFQASSSTIPQFYSKIMIEGYLWTKARAKGCSTFWDSGGVSYGAWYWLRV